MITLIFVYTEYTPQGVIFKSAILDLKYKANKSSTKSHGWFCSTYMQLFRLWNLEEISLLAFIRLNNINN